MYIMVGIFVCLHEGGGAARGMGLAKNHEKSEMFTK